MNSIWQVIRLYYGFQSTGSHIFDLSDIKLDSNERLEDLFQRLNAFIEDNLLEKCSNISHHGENVYTYEEMTLTLENILFLTWLLLVDVNLPKFVKQRYGTELRSGTLASIKPEISLALISLVLELQAVEYAQILRTGFRLSGFSRKRFSKDTNFV